MPLTDIAVRQARATGKAYTLGDGRGMALNVAANGSKNWHFRYRWLGKQRRMSLGTYPEVSLKEARTRREAARALVARGVNLQEYRKHERLVRHMAEEQVFQTVFDTWVEHRRLSLKPKRQGSLLQIQRIFRKDIPPTLRKRSIYDISRSDLVAVLAKIEARGALTIAQKCRLWLRQLFRFAMVKFPGLERNPALDLDAVALPRVPVAHNPFLRVEELPLLLQGLSGYRGDQQIRLGLRLLLLTGVRTGELRSATPDQFDLERGLWVVPAVLVKQLQLTIRKQGKQSQDVPPYVVPLSNQALEVVRQLLGFVRPGQRHLLSQRGDVKKPISENTLNQALESLGFKGRLTSHGIRATIATALNEYGYPKAWIDAQLSHADAEGGGTAYNHAEYIEQRRRMMQDWADRLDQMEQGAVAVTSASTMGPAVASRDAEKEQVARVLYLEGGTMVIIVPPGSPDLVKGSAISVSDSSALRLPPSACDRLEAYEAPHNLPLSAYAVLARKSCEQIIGDIKARRLLALSLDDRGCRIPDWQLDPTKYLLTLTVLTHADQADAWDVYWALSRSMGRLGSRAPLEMVTSSTILEVGEIVCASLRERRLDA
ncbi:integrase [Pseudoxanthomonas broegbernensis]|uniref:Integrase n=1 Tax=Pseudoxanthomonas broegbernensis TaxID=83619 RepID=A0A7V8GP32_9GAMM|nr:integrase arm-type DNA-binding domain-containing protein [Pseudoxanthomonas broegbernensis]KAF1687351.1 integrase [Pseudoxanthomonas broegbernensis]MBB6065647.1 integrase [Pseudoxanthomonas broegbernensis]